MADQVDVSKLTDEQLAVYRDLVAAEAMKDPANNPPPAQPPQLLGTHGLPASWMVRPSTSDVVPPLSRTTHTDVNTGRTTHLWERVNADPQLQQTADSTDDLGMPGVASTHNAAALTPSEFAAMIPGYNWVKALNAGTTRTTADLGTNLLLHGTSGLLQGVGVANRYGNAVVGGLKNLGQFELGTRAHDLMTGKDPTAGFGDRSTSQNIFEALAGTLGAAGGFKSGAPPKDPLADARQEFQTHMEQQNSKAKEIDALNSADKQLETQETTAKRALDDAKLRLANHKARMDSTTEDAEEKALKDQVDSAQEDLKNKTAALTEHQKKISGAGDFSSNITANKLSDQILDYQDQLDAHKSQGAPSTSSTSQEELDLQDKIKAIKDGLESGNWRGAVKAAKTRQLADYTKSFGDYQTQRTGADASALEAYNTQRDAFASKLRELKDQRTRVLGGRTVETDPTDLIQMLNEGAAKQSDVDSSAAALRAINERYKAGTTINTQNMAQKRQDLMDSVAQATDAHRQVQDTRQAGQQKKVDLTAVLNELKRNAPDKPVDAKTSGPVKNLIKAALPAVGLGAGEHASGSWLSLGPVIGAVAGMGANALMSTGAAQKFMEFLSDHMPQNADKAVPALVNQGARQQ